MTTQSIPGPGDRLLARLRSFVGQDHVLTDERSTRAFRKGYRYGDGSVLAVVRPGSLLEQWRVFSACVEAGCIVIMQAANTGLNGGSTPFGDDYDRPVVVINTLRIDRIDLLDGGQQVLCLAGSTLHALEKKIRPLGREPHSVIGSTTIGASVVGGVCNNSGGALLRRGPAYTQLALYARVDEAGHAELVNHLGIALGSDPEDILSRLDRGDYTQADIVHDQTRRASDPDYASLVRDIEAPSPARFNNDPRLLFETAGSAGKLCVFAVRLDTFPSAGPSKVFYIGSNDPGELTEIRRRILGSFANLPVAGEYLHQRAYRIAETYGKDLYLLIKHAGTEQIPTAFKLKTRFDAVASRLGLGSNLSDRLLQAAVKLLPNHLPARMNQFRDRYTHHLLLRMDGEGIEEARRYLSSIFPSAMGDYFECDDEEAAAAFRHRYTVSGSAIRYRAVHPDTVEDIVALDLALPRNTFDWQESLPSGVREQVEQTILCGHFFCQVFHYDYAIKKGADYHAIEEAIVAHLDSSGIEFPSEHNVGHLYRAKPDLVRFYRDLDPTNTMNPGIGKTPKGIGWTV